MFHWLGESLSKYWLIVLGLWLTGFVGLHLTAPQFNDFAKQGEFVFLPEHMPSREGEALLNKAFPGRDASSSMVIVVSRDSESGLTDADHNFIDQTLRPDLESIRDTVNDQTGKSSDGDSAKPGLIGNIHTFSDANIGSLLESADGKASLVTISLPIDYRDTRNWQPVQKVSDFLNSYGHDKRLPQGLELALTGSATLGHDLSTAEAASARNTGPLTIGLVIMLLAVIYRAPLIAIVPLLTLFVSVDIALHLLAMLAKAGYVTLFKGLQEYTTVITYGPGIDYCLFLIARYEENLEDCDSPKTALANAIGQVGPAILASAATVTCGIAMLSFAQFGKFHEAGIGISFALATTLIATLTLTPSLLFLVGHWAFWPKPGVRCSENEAAGAQPHVRAVQKDLFAPLWDFMAHAIERHPMRLLLLTLGGMLPFVVLAVNIYSHVNYGLLESLPKGATSSVGARELAKHFPAGITGPVNVLLQNPKVDFSDDAGMEFVDGIVQKLMQRHDELQIADIRSVSNPLGTLQLSDSTSADESSFQRMFRRKAKRERSVEHYVSTVSGLDGHVTSMDIVLTTNPFSIDSIHALDKLTAAIQQSLPSDQPGNTSIAFVGPTASVRDVSTISRSDQERIYVIVVAGVFAILVALLRAVFLSLYLMVTVLLSYLATLGVTWLLFYSLDPQGFVGLDWTVPLFLFVVLIAVGEDYNIFLVTRIHEEQKRHGAKAGITVALSKTGSIISSCGFIMAGTFASLSIGTLARMQQLGFALAFGVLLDTFVIRPIVVPAFLTVLNEERFGNLARYLK